MPVSQQRTLKFPCCSVWRKENALEFPQVTELCRLIIRCQHTEIPATNGTLLCQTCRCPESQAGHCSFCVPSTSLLLPPPLHQSHFLPGCIVFLWNSIYAGTFSPEKILLSSAAVALSERHNSSLRSTVSKF